MIGWVGAKRIRGRGLCFGCLILGGATHVRKICIGRMDASIQFTANKRLFTKELFFIMSETNKRFFFQRGFHEALRYGASGSISLRLKLMRRCYATIIATQAVLPGCLKML